MLRSGLSSASYRNATPANIIKAAKLAGLSGIEWSADTHAPHGDLERAEELMMETLRARLTVSAYGSFFRLQSGDNLALFDEILETTRRLQSPIIRIWAAAENAKTSLREDFLPLLADQGKHLADRAGRFGITLCLEAHEKTLISDYELQADLLDAVSHPFFKACWTPLAPLEGTDRLSSLERFIDRIALVHVRNWSPGYDRLPLRMDDECWTRVLGSFRATAGKSVLDHWALIEYLEDDKPETLSREAESLSRLLALGHTHETQVSP